jgi:hypothetical protein
MIITQCYFEETPNSKSGTTTCEYPYFTAVDDGQGGLIYINTMWSAPDLILVFFVVICSVFIISKGIFNFFFPPISKKIA